MPRRPVCFDLFRRGIATAMMGLLLVGCSGSGTGLAGDMIVASKCPAGGCVDPTSDEAQLSISGPGRTSVYVPPVVSGGAIIDQVEFGGDCYASTFPNNFIEVSLFVGSSPIALTAADKAPTRTGATGNEIKCVNGRFGFAIDGARMPSGSIYRAQVAIVGIDANGGQHRNAGSGLFSLSISR